MPNFDVEITVDDVFSYINGTHDTYIDEDDVDPKIVEDYITNEVNAYLSRGEDVNKLEVIGVAAINTLKYTGLM